MNVARRVAAALLALCAALAPAAARARFDEAPAQIVSAARIASLADRVARAAVNDAARALAPAFVITDQTVPAGTVSLSSGTPNVNASYVSVPVAIAIDGRLARTVYAGYRITTYVETAVAAHDLAQGEILGPGDITLARIPFAGRMPLGAETFIGRKVRTQLARGSVLYPESTAVNEIVRAGMPALLIVHDGAVSIAADVVARTSGGLGDTVTIFNPQTQKALSGIVTAPNIVELTLPGAN